MGAASQTWTHGYDKTDNRVSVTDPRSNVHQWAFDSLNRLMRETDEGSAQVNLTRNGKDEITVYSDPRALTTTYVRNGFGDVIQRLSPDSGTTVYEVSALGKATKITDGRGVISNLLYDNAGRLLGIDYPAAPAENLTYTWDSTANGNKGIGRLTGIGDASGSIARIFDALGRIVSETKTTGMAPYPVAYQHDAAGNVAQITYPSGRIVIFARDALGRISGVTTKKDAGSPPVTLASAVTYQPFGPLNGLTYGNNLVLAKTFTSDYLLNALTVQDGATVVLNRTHAFTDGFNLTGITDNLIPARTETYTYTAPNRLASATGIWGSLAWTYDGVGNRLSELLGATSTFTYPPASNRLSSVTQGSITLRTFAHDGAGNITADTRGTTTYAYRYNNRGRIDQLTIDTTVAASYAYDGLERMALRSTTSPAATTHYVYDLSGRLITEANPAGQTLREYVWLDDMPLAVVADVDTASPQLWLVHADHLDRPLKMTDGTQAIVWDAVYRPFGEIVSITGSAALDLRFPGQYFLIESGLHYNWHRHYDPTIGRYVQADPLSASLRWRVTPLDITSEGRLTDAGFDTNPITAGRQPFRDISVLLQSPQAEAPGATVSAHRLADMPEFADGPSIYSYARSAPTMSVDPRGLLIGPFTPIPRRTEQCVTPINVIRICMLVGQARVSGQGSIPSTVCIYEGAGGARARVQTLGIVSCKAFVPC